MHRVVVQVWVFKKSDLKNGDVVVVPDGYSIHKSFKDAYNFRGHMVNSIFNYPLYFSGKPYCVMVGKKKYEALLKFGALYFSKKPPSVRRCRRPKI